MVEELDSFVKDKLEMFDLYHFKSNILIPKNTVRDLFCALSGAYASKFNLNELDHSIYKRFFNKNFYKVYDFDVQFFKEEELLLYHTKDDLYINLIKLIRKFENERRR